MFQSLISILMNCNLLASALNAGISLFQSLIGILINCNAILKPIPLLAGYVSIPNRDFDELQCPILLAVLLGIVFQSLIGILMNCNRIVPSHW